MTTLKFEGYTYDTETRKVEFTEVICWNCKGQGSVREYILCPHNHKTVRGFPGSKCPCCGAKNKDSHQTVGSHIVPCNVCAGNGTRIPNKYDSFDMRPLFDFITIRLLKGNHTATMNESYLGRGIIGGCTDYGRYLDEIDHDITKMVQYARDNSMERNSRTQALNLLDDDGCLIKLAVVKMNDSGWSMFSVNAGHSVFHTEE